jgi:hypothetical protein
VEYYEDIIADIDQALRAIGAGKKAPEPVLARTKTAR